MRLGKCATDSIALHEYVPRLRHCAVARSLGEGKRLHAQLIDIGLDTSTFVGNLLVYMYAKCGSVDNAQFAFARINHPNLYTSNIVISLLSRDGRSVEAKKIFDNAAKRDRISWNSMIGAYARSGNLSEAREMLDRLPEKGLVACNLVMHGYVQESRIDEASEIFDAIEQPDSISCHTMLVGYAQAGKLHAAKEMFDRIPENDVLSWNTMIQAYTQCGHLAQGNILFDLMPQRNAVAWSLMMISYAKISKVSTAIDLFQAMPGRDFIAWNVLLTAVSMNGHLSQGRAALDRMPLHGTAAWNSLIQGAIQFESYSLAKDLLEQIPERDITSYNLMLQVSWSSPDRAARIFSRMPQRNLVSWTAFLGVLSQSGQIHRAEELFGSMRERNTLAWNIMIAAFARAGQWKRSIALVAEMDVEGSTPDKTVFSAALDSCSSAAALSEGRLLHREAAAAGLERDLSVATSIINMYGKCGRSLQARDLFDKIDCKDVVLWTAMFGAYAHSGDALAVIDLFPSLELEGCGSDAVALLSVLSACIHAGRHHAARRCFLSMMPDYGVCPRVEHYVCMVDLLGRGGQTDLAEELVRSMPFHADCVAWMILLCACRIHSDVDRGEASAEKILELDPENCGALVQLLGLYEESGMRSRTGDGIKEAMEGDKLDQFREFNRRRDEIDAELRMIEEMIQEAR